MSKRRLILAVTGLAVGVTACGSYGTSVDVTTEHNPAPVASISVALPQPSLLAGQKEQGTAIARDGSGAPLTGRVITWQSSAPASASVDGSGMISAVAPGTATITASSEGVTGQESLTVLAPPPAAVATVGVSLGASSLVIGQTTPATATLRDAGGNTLTGRTVTWQSSNPGVASVSGTGTVSALAAGTTTISASSEGQTGSAGLTVTAPAPIPVASVSVSPAGPSIQVGSTVQLSAVTRDANGNTLTGRTVTWQSSNQGVATVSASGNVSGVGAGTATITASSEGQSGSASVTVNAPAPVPVATVTVSPSTPGIQVGASVQLSAVTRDANGNTLTGRVVTWSSSSNAVATVSSSGNVTGVSAGSATITATSETRTGTATVTVTLTPIASISVSPSAPSINVGATAQLTATARDAGGNVLTGRTFTWASGNTSIATVNSSGQVTGVAAGSTSITATNGAISGTANVTVTTPPPPPPPGSSPEPGAGDVILWSDNFDGATLAAQLQAYNPTGSISRVTDGHSGSAVRFSYSPGNDDNLIEKTFPVTQDGYYRYYFRISPGALPYSGRTGSGMKWFMPWRAVGYRYTMGVGMLTSPAWQFTSHDNTSSTQPNPVGQNISQTPRFDTVNDGQWHEYTLHIKTTSPAGEQIWIDGILVLDDFAQGYDHSAEGISLVQFPGLVVDGIPDSAHSFTIDIDDFVIWHK